MKSLVTLIVCLLTVSLFAAAKEDLSTIHKRQRIERHEETRKWDHMEADCITKFPKRFDSSSPDYDGYFKCKESINDVMQAFTDKNDKEVCDKLQISCKGK
jgi:hypothetical protein